MSSPSPTSAGFPEIPEIPECSVTRGEDGRIRVTHKRTGRTAVAGDSTEDLIIQGAILRCLASYPWLRYRRAGDLT